MSIINVGGFLAISFGMAYGTLKEAVTASSPGDIISIKKSITISDPVNINHDLTIEGNGNYINIDDFELGINVTSGKVNIKNATFINGYQCNAIKISSNDSVHLSLNNVTIKRDGLIPDDIEQLDFNDSYQKALYASNKYDFFYPGIYADEKHEIVTMDLHECRIDFIVVAGLEQIKIDQDSEIGDPVTRQSIVSAKAIDIDTTKLSNINVKTINEDTVINMNNITTYGNLSVNGNLDLNGFSVIPLPNYRSKAGWKFLIYTFDQEPNVYALSIDGIYDNSSNNRVSISNASLNHQGLMAQSSFYSVSAWFHFSNSLVTFNNCQATVTIGHNNYSLGSHIVFNNSYIEGSFDEFNYVAAIDDNKYLSLNDAIEDANDDSQISIIRDVLLTNTVDVKNSITINGNNHQIRSVNSLNCFDIISGDIRFNDFRVLLDNQSTFIHKSHARVTNLILNNIKIKHSELSRKTTPSIISKINEHTAYHSDYDYNFNYIYDPNFTLSIYQSEIDLVEIADIKEITISKDSIIGSEIAKCSQISALKININNSQICNIKLTGTEPLNYIMMKNISTTGYIITDGNLTLENLTVIPLPYKKSSAFKRVKNKMDNYALSTTSSLSIASVEINHFKTDNSSLYRDNSRFPSAWFKFDHSDVVIDNSEINETNEMPNISKHSTVEYKSGSIDHSKWHVFERVDSDQYTVIENNHPLPNKNSQLDEQPINEKNATSAINSLIGLSDAKQQLQKFIDVAKLNKIRENRGIQSNKATMNMVFTGNPGTGKTIVARLFAKALFENGVLKTDKLIEVKAKDLVASYVGQTAKLTSDKVNQALDGVLFIDEAYSLAPPKNDEGSFNNEAIDELIADMENYRHRLVVIMAGYQDEMNSFFNRSNPGLTSRFPNKILFPDYNEAELMQIFDFQLSRQFRDNDGNYIAQGCTPEARKLVQDTVEKLYQADKIRDNARFIRDQVIGKILEANSERIATEIRINENDSSISDTELNTFNETDVQKAMGPILKSFGVKNSYEKQSNHVPSAINQLNSLIGLTSVKKEATQIINLAKLNEIKKSNQIPVQSTSMNMVFKGNPGTGKTVVARLFAKALYENGVIKTDKLVETKAEDLVGQYVGQSAPKTNTVIKSALNGVLFIDEAYQLTPENGNDYNSEVITELITDVENYRDKLVVIMAGYPKQMENFLNESNPGLVSRFPNQIVFKDYSADELFEILKYNLKDKGLLCSDDTLLILHLGIVNYVKNQDNNGNGRFIRNLVEKMTIYQANRLQELFLKIGSGNQLSDSQKEQVITLTDDDAKNALCDLLVID
ncbi:AAA family ATPase [Lactobacillaceae bacterium Scapto_B20]